MTTEIAVLNRLGVALAADSAVTISGGGTTKVFDSADKLFELSCHFPVALMLNGNMDCFGIPWEIIIKDFRELHGKTQRISIEKWVADFVSYVEARSDIDNISANEYIRHICIREIDSLKKYVSRLFWEDKSSISKNLDDGVSDLMQRAVFNRRDVLNQIPIAKSLEDVSTDDLISLYGMFVRDIIIEEVKPLTISDGTIDIITRFIFDVIRSTIRSQYHTGLIFAGYAQSDMYPSVMSVDIDGYINDRLKYSKIENRAEIKRPELGCAVSFAQTDVIERLLSGVDPRFISKTAEFLIDAFESIADELVVSVSPKISTKRKAVEAEKIREILSIITETYVIETSTNFKKEFGEEFERMIALMPKLELIELAEALISITAIERKATSDEGTVGGPVDVAFLTKHEGFVWIKRKHYFEPSLNPRYFWRKYPSMNGGH